MFKTNVGGVDRILRVVAGLALFAGFFIFREAEWRWVLLVPGIAALFTGLAQYCPMYQLLGISTCPAKKR